MVWTRGAGEGPGDPPDPGRIARLVLEASTSTADAISILEELVDAEGRTTDFRMVFTNVAATQVTGFDPAEATGRTVRELFPDNADWLVALWSAAVRSGEPIVEEIELRPGQTGSPWIRQQIVPLDGAVAITSHDITARKEAERELWHLAHHDPLTGLPNRTLAESRIDRLVARSDCVVMFIDVDHFKTVNDRLGHLAGDEMLSQVAGRLRSCMRNDDLVARFGGDEFVVCVVEDPTDPGPRLVEKIMDSMRYPFHIAGRNITTTISIGIAHGRAGDSPSELLRRADAAVYRSKGRGRDRWTVFDEEMGDALAAQDLADQALRDALDGHRVEYRPVPFVHLSDGVLHSVVLSACWEHPALGRQDVHDYLAGTPDPGLVGRLDAELLRVDTETVVSTVATLAPGARVRFTLHGDLVDDVTVLELERRLADAGVRAVQWGLDVPSAVLGASGSVGRAALGLVGTMGVAVTLYGTPRSLVSDEDLSSIGVRALQINPRPIRGGTIVDRQLGATLSSVAAFARQLGIDLIVSDLSSSQDLATLSALGVTVVQGPDLEPNVSSQHPGGTW